MATREKKGTAEYRNGQWFAKIWIALDGGAMQRRKRKLDGLTHEEDDRDAAFAKARILQERASGLTFAAGPLKPSIAFEDFADKWLETRKANHSYRKDEQRMRDFVTPFFKGVPLDEINNNPPERRIHAFKKSLMDRVADPGADFGPKMARHCWTLLRGVFEAACDPERPELCVLATNPVLGVKGPPKGHDVEMQWLYPEEFQRLMLCADVPSRWRRIYAITTVLYLRVGEAKALRFADLDLEHGRARIHEQIDEKGARRETKKMGAIRRFNIEPVLLPLLAAMRAEEPDDELVLSSVDRASELLREHLQRAGINRTELFERTARSIPIRFHDLRATGITWAALRGDTLLRIRERAGHKDVEQTERYVRRADEVTAATVGSPFPALPSSLLERPRYHGLRRGAAGDLSPTAVPSNLSPSLSIRNVAGFSVRRGGLETPDPASNMLDREAFREVADRTIAHEKHEGTVKGTAPAGGRRDLATLARAVLEGAQAGDPAGLVAAVELARAVLELPAPVPYAVEGEALGPILPAEGRRHG